ncbi:probable polyamine transporter At1g31830 [Zingiber officinale]|uniref:probable polyamine transporter At1g31830 n=1 Tax=Zingiber officinale TaxID=94328 RepID=UPI001C4D7664|nr:probable polyamine transporter At1g31830 [Zingiber officinale]
MSQYLPSPPSPPPLPDQKRRGDCASSPANGHDPPSKSEDPSDSDCRSGGQPTEQLEQPRPMGEVGGGDGVPYQGLGDRRRPEKRHKLSILPLVFLIFYEVSGGPFGVEDSVGAGGPLLALLGFLLFPLIWSVPEALITAELGTMFPENGGYVVWVSSALGPFCGFQQGWMKWLSGVIDNALYPILFLDYLKSAIPRLAAGPPRGLAALALTVLLTYMNYRGLTVVGGMAVFLGAFSVLPFLVMGVVAVPKLKPKRWVGVDFHNVDWNLYLNTLFWNLNYWDSISTLAGEVSNPAKTLPRSLFYAVILVVSAYLFPLFVGTGALPVDRDEWADGYFSDVALAVGGLWLSWWVRAAAAVSNMGMFVAEMSSDSYQLLGMAERGMLPEAFARRSRHGTPLLGILFSASGVVLLSWLSFQEIVAAENFLYCFGMLMEFAAFVRLRMKHPTAARPYKIPLGTVGCVLMLVPPTVLILVVLALSSLNVALVSGGAVALGLVLRPGLQWAERRRWLKFSVNPELADFCTVAGETTNATDHPPIRDLEVNSARNL